jgi:Ribonuclease G/E
VTGAAARAAADEAQDEALATLFALPGGGEVAIERTRALTAVDIDIGERAGGDAKRVTRAANLAAIALAARVLRLKGQGGLVVIDLAGRGHDGAALLAAARQAFAPDNPGVALGPISRFGTLELTVPRRARPVLELLADVAGRPTVRTTALALVRALEREAGADGGARLEAAAHPGLASAAAPLVEVLKRRIGARVAVRADDAVAPGAYVIRPL